MAQTNPTDDAPPAHALLLVAPGCPHCATMLDGLGTLVKEGTLARLEVVNIAAAPSVAAELSVRSVPWARVGAFDLAGLHTLEELRHWTRLAGEENGMTLYLADLLATGRRSQVAERVRQDPALLQRLVDLLGDDDTGLSVRIGVMATFEELQDSGMLDGLAESLAPLTRHPEPRVRADGCHALALTGSTDAIGWVESCTNDPDPEVRETAADALEMLAKARPARETR
ncbi:hypothetical protein TVNIR_1959 [Thioalkalivibrio nitratireducens DSM 14787]|uniref:Thioredoxin-like fold domain-containing protein n=1 Tax=Thioalkalivibrio nitratireducens (strain DSM 14787 / UNIQEM 213 / ALEN2) TaxID=1255043 RepID=L0DXC9_THIND|nr:HEAT repeat domain-containing protein [Thioalkalivibrio nitratireducens]AGA33620.1 hypothetical protein TVNIR_1959 [Thioalkalivibrio nitratireducens DSM 14787]